MRDEFRQLSNRLMRIFERKCFYAQSGGTHGKAPVVKRGKKATPKPPADYAEQQKVQATGIPKGFQAVKAPYLRTRPGPSKISLAQVAAVVHPGSSSARLIPVNNDTALDEPVAVPQEPGAARVEAVEHNKRVDIKRMVNEAFVSRDQPSSQYQEQTSLGPSDQRPSGVPPGPSKTLRHQRSIATKAIRMIANRVIEPVVDPATGRYVVSLDDLRNQSNAVPPVETPTARRYIPRPVHTLREMVDSARRGPSATIQPIHSTGSRPQGARVSRIDQAPRSTYRPSGAVIAQHQQLPSTSTGTRIPVLRGPITTQVPRNLALPVGNAAMTAPSTTRNDHVYPRSHSSGRTAQTSNNSRRSASSGRPIIAAAVAQQGNADVDDDDEIIEVDDDPVVVDASQTQAQAPATVGHRASTTLSQETQPRLPDQNTAPVVAKGPLESTVIPSQEQNAEKTRYVQVRDEQGFLRRCLRLPDGTLVLSNRKPKAMTRIRLPQSGIEATSGASQDHARTPTAGAVYATHSMTRKDESRLGKQSEQVWKRSQASVAPWSHTATVAPQRQDPVRQGSNELVHEGARSSLVTGRVPSKAWLCTRGRMTDIIVISEQSPEKKTRSRSRRPRKPVKEPDPSPVVTPRGRSRAPKQLSRLCAVPQISKNEEEQREALRRRLHKQQEEDSENLTIDITAEDEALSNKVKELVDALPPVEHSECEEPLTSERKKAGRPPKKFRGRLAKQKQAIRDAELAEKVAIKQRELPVLDLALKVIDDPSVELPEEAPIVVDNLVELDTTTLHEVGEVLKELVAQVSLNELRKSNREVKTRSRRRWEHLPERVPSKRQEGRALKHRVPEISPSPPPPRSRHKARNSDKHRQNASAKPVQQNDAARPVQQTDAAIPVHQNDADTSIEIIDVESVGPVRPKSRATSSRRAPRTVKAVAAPQSIKTVAAPLQKTAPLQMAVQVVEEVARSPMLPANFPKSPERVRVVSQSLQRPTAPVPPKQSAAGSWDQEVSCDISMTTSIISCFVETKLAISYNNVSGPVPLTR
ncbi:hypothetical protein COOONC_05522, partial [Cooperia oncophora]